ncbi:nicotinate phosphoribosyltransferase [compost metagenome]
MFHPVHTYIAKFVTNFEARELHHTIFEAGELVYQLPTIQEIKQFAADNLHTLWDEYKRLLNPAEYPVNLSQDCWNNKMRLIEEAQQKVQQRMTNQDG